MSEPREVLKDVVSERAVLASVFEHGSDCYIEIVDLVSVDSFTLGSNQAFWKCLDHILQDNPEAKIDYPTVMAAAQSLGLASFFAKDTEQTHLRSIMNLAPMTRKENVRKLAGRIRKLQCAREAWEFHEVAQQNLLTITGDDPIDRIRSISEEPSVLLNDKLMSAGGREGLKPIGEGLRAYAKYLAENQRDIVGLSSGFPRYDAAIGGGFRPGSVNVIGARTKVGKTFIAMNMGVHVAGVLGVPVLDLDTELTKEKQWDRMLARMSGVPSIDIQRGIYANCPKKLRLVNEAIDKLEAMPFTFELIGGQPFDETLAVMRRWLTKKVGFDDNGQAKPCLIIFDYLKLMDSSPMDSKNLAEHQVLGFMMTGLHNFAVRYKIPILALGQTNRDGIDVEDTSVMAGSDRIAWLCSNLTILKTKSDSELADQSDSDSKYNRKLVLLATRDGPGLDEGDYINVAFRGETSLMTEGPRRNELGKSKNSNTQAKGTFVNGDTNSQDEVGFAA